jgi:hypothetical protein
MAALGFAGLSASDRTLHVLRSYLDSWASIGRIVVGMAGLRPATDAIRRARVARDVLHRWDGTLADERDGHPWHAVQRRRAVTHPLRRLWCHFIITPLTTALILAGCAASGVLDVSWVATTTNVDGSPLTDVATYLVYYSTADAPCTKGKSIRVATRQAPAPGQRIVFRLSGLTVGQLYYVAVAAVTSTEVSKCSTTESARARQP